jgi:hypothetical protein
MFKVLEEFRAGLGCTGLDLFDVGWRTGETFLGISLGVEATPDWESSITGASGRSTDVLEAERLGVIWGNPICGMTGLGSVEVGVDGGDILASLGGCTGSITGET